MPNFTLLDCDNITVEAENGMNCSFYMPDGSQDLYEPSLGIVILLAICYGGISLGSVLGNTLVIYMVIRSRRMKTITNFFIANLALSDVVIGTFSIPFQFQAALLQRWNLPEIMCSLCPFFQNVSVNTSIFTLIAIALDRYNAIIHPLRGKSSKKGTKVRIGFIWVTSILLAVPQVIAFRVMLVDGSIPQCIPVNISPTTLTWYMFALCFVQYFLPLCLISFAYLRIGMNLWGRRAPGEAEERRDATILKNKKKAIKVLMFVVGLFAICWLPLQSYSVLSVIAPRINEFKYINIVWFCSHWLAMSNSCFNPFIYFLCHDKFKKEFQNQFKWCFRKLSQRRKLRQRQQSGSMTIYNGKFVDVAESISSGGERNNELTRQDTAFFRPR